MPIQRIKRAVARILGRHTELIEPNCQEIERLRSAPRRTPLTTDLLGPHFDLVDGASFISCYENIIRKGVYRFGSATDTPFIVDCGANVGVSIVYFKQLYPRSRILAFEADPAVFATLEGNVRRAGYTDVEIINKAVWTETGEIGFWHEGADAGRIALDSCSNPPNRSMVPTTRLRDYLREPIDLLKLDIEGAEVDVLLDCADRLQAVRALFVEYHSFSSRPQRLDILTTTLASAGFRLFVQTELCPPQPFMSRTPYLGMDLQLNIFAVREA